MCSTVIEMQRAKKRLVCVGREGKDGGAEQLLPMLAVWVVFVMCNRPNTQADVQKVLFFWAYQ